MTHDEKLAILKIMVGNEDTDEMLSTYLNIAGRHLFKTVFAKSQWIIGNIHHACKRLSVCTHRNCIVWSIENRHHRRLRSIPGLQHGYRHGLVRPGGRSKKGNRHLQKSRIQGLPLRRNYERNRKISGRSLIVSDEIIRSQKSGAAIHVLRFFLQNDGLKKDRDHNGHGLFYAEKRRKTYFLFSFAFSARPSA